MILETEIDGLLYSLDTDEQEATVKECMDKYHVGEIVIPSSFFYEGILYEVISIGNNAFCDCRRLITITIPEGVTSIGNSAFDGCSSLTAITIPKSVTSIGDVAFRWCTSLAAIKISEGVKSIGWGAFVACHNLAAIKIPESVTRIGNCAFAYCYNLTIIVVAERNTTYDSRGGCNAIIEKISNTLIVGCSTTITHEGVTSIGVGAFDGCSRLTTINIPESVTSIGKHAFQRCTSLTDITIPESVTRIGNCAFEKCNSLNSIVIPRNVELIEGSAFSYCGITSLTILGRTRIESSAFEGCDKLTDVYNYSEDVPWASEFFYSCFRTGTLHVPKSARKKYKNTEPWCRFGTIVAIK